MDLCEVLKHPKVGAVDPKGLTFTTSAVSGLLDWVPWPKEGVSDFAQSRTCHMLTSPRWRPPPTRGRNCPSTFALVCTMPGWSKSYVP